MKRILYLFYYLKNTDFKKLRKFNRFAAKETGKSSLQLHWDSLLSVFKYNTGLLDYYQFGFHKMGSEERRAWAGTGFMYEYQLKANPTEKRDLLENKIKFLQHFKRFNKRRFLTIEELTQNPDAFTWFINQASGKAVLKASKGQVGAEVEVIDSNKYTADALIKYMNARHYDLLEEYVVQHPALMQMSPSGLNTVRVFAELKGDEVVFLGARLRITINSAVDNMAAGNPAAPVDVETGRVIGPAVFSDITREDISLHPVSQTPIVGFVVPFWDEIRNMIIQATKDCGGNSSIGWDVAITESGPELIEGNHNWCKLLWQLPVKKGLKHLLTFETHE